MATKTSLSGIVVDHLGTLWDARTHRVSALDLVIQFGLPLVLGLGLPLAGFRLVDVGQVIAGLAVLAGFTFGMLVFVFQLRLQVATDPRVVGTNLRELIDELFTNVAYALLVGLACVTLAVVFVSVRQVSSPSPDLVSVLRAVATGVLVATTSHFLLTLAMCTKRAYRAYQRIT